MKNKLELHNRHPLCTIATMYDHLRLNGCTIPFELLYLASITSFLIGGRKIYNNIPMFFTAPIENSIALKLFQKLTLKIEKIDLKKALENKNCENVIAELDFSIQSPHVKQRSYNIAPIHTVLIIEHNCDNQWYINDGIYNEKNAIEHFLSVRQQSIEQANALYLVPYETKKYVYRIISPPDEKILQERILHIIQQNIKMIIFYMQECCEPTQDGDVTSYTGYAAYQQFIKEITVLKSIYSEGKKEQQRIVSIRLMIMRRFLLSNLGAKDCCRTELASAFRFYGEYIHSNEFEEVAEMLEKTIPYWRPLAALLEKQAYNAVDKNYFDQILANLTTITELERKAANILQNIYTP